MPDRRLSDMSGRKKSAFPGYSVEASVLVVLAAWCFLKAREKRRRHARLLLQLREGSKGKVLDLRDVSCFRLARVRGSHNIPAESLSGDNRWHELPEQHEKLLVLLPPETAGKTHASLEKEIADRRAPGATMALLADEELFRLAREIGIVEEGAPTTGAGSAASTLFTPCPFLARVVETVVEPNLSPCRVPMTCIDVGCGSGRDAVWLALRGWKVTAMDSCDPALHKVSKLSERMGVGGSVDVVRGKVKKSGDIHLWTEARISRRSPNEDARTGPEGPSESSTRVDTSGDYADRNSRERIIGSTTPDADHGAYGLVVTVRFLERAAYDTLARLVDPRGGYLLLSTFIEEEKAEAMPGGASVESPPSHAFDEAAVVAGQDGDTAGDGGMVSRGGSCSGVGREDARPEETRPGATAGGGRGFSSAVSEQGAAAATLTMVRWPHETPRDPKKILRRGELARIFGERLGFEVVEDSVERLADGRPMACFLARKVSEMIDDR